MVRVALLKGVLYGLIVMYFDMDIIFSSFYVMWLLKVVYEVLQVSTRKHLRVLKICCLRGS